LLFAARPALRPVFLAVDFTGKRLETGELQGLAYGLVTIGAYDGGIDDRGL
jgi:hypothetical protein